MGKNAEKKINSANEYFSNSAPEKTEAKAETKQTITTTTGILRKNLKFQNKKGK